MRPHSSNSTATTSRGGVTRRGVIGGAAAALTLSALPVNAFAFSAQLTRPAGVPRRAGAEPTLAKHLCRETHGRIAAQLDAIIADLAIDGERTSLALMEARCPGCGQRVEPASSRISAVIPQWKPHVAGPQKYGAKA